ncbi:hypothetical protein [Streptomyces sp. LN325]|uniref:hypothetical protein n=1 Tax=Streptomyces sp. LN325 TaxID=3112976 RepID=UPI00371B9586
MTASPHVSVTLPGGIVDTVVIGGAPTVTDAALTAAPAPLGAAAVGAAATVIPWSGTADASAAIGDSAVARTVAHGQVPLRSGIRAGKDGWAGPRGPAHPSCPACADSATTLRFQALSAPCGGLPRYLRFRVKLPVTVAPFWIFTVVTVGW